VVSAPPRYFTFSVDLRGCKLYLKLVHQKLWKSIARGVRKLVSEKFVRKINDI